MRLGWVIYGSLETLTGGYLYDRIVVEGLRQLGHEVEVIGLPSGSYLRRLGLGFSGRLSHRLSAKNFDIIIEDELCHPSLFLINKRLHRHGGPLQIALVHHLLSDEPRGHWQNRLLAFIERRFLCSVDGFIHNSQTTRQTVSSQIDHMLPQVVAYPAGDRFGSPLSADFISKRAHRSGPLELLFLGSVIPRKGLLPLLEALSGIESVPWRLSVVGGLDFDHDYTARSKKFVQQFGLSDSVRFLGPLRDKQLVETFTTNHLFCMPYAYEGFGIAILEAMAFGLPAIGSQDGAAGETIRHGINGFLVAPGDLAGLRSILLDLHQDRQRLLRLSLSATASYAESPTWQDCTRIIDKFLREIKAMHDRREDADAGK